jgi:hypothetical protein
LRDYLPLMDSLLSRVSGSVDRLSDDDLRRFRAEYNAYASVINAALNQVGTLEVDEGALQAKVEAFTKTLSPVEQKEMELFAMELWREMYPPSYSEAIYEQLVQHFPMSTGHLALPFGALDGAESVVTGALSLLDKQTYEDLGKAASTAWNMDGQDWKRTGDFLYTVMKKTPPDKYLFALSSLLASPLLVFGLVGKAQKALSVSKVPGCAQRLMNAKELRALDVKMRLTRLLVGQGIGMRESAQTAMVLPATAIGGAYFKYFGDTK